MSEGFAADSNPNGPWSYGWVRELSGPFSLLTVPHLSRVDNGAMVPSWQLTSSQEPVVFHNSNDSTITVGNGATAFEPGEMWFHPGQDGRQENFGVIRFTVPSGAGGHYEIRTAVAPVYHGSPQGDTDFHVVHNGEEIFGRFLDIADKTGYTNILSLEAGDTVDFAIGRGADGRLSGSCLRIAGVLSLTTNAPPPPPPSPLDQLLELVENLPESVNAAPLTTTLRAVLASLARGNQRAAINQLHAFQNKVEAQVSPIDDLLANELIGLAQEVIESLDPTRKNRSELAAMAGMPMKASRSHKLSPHGVCIHWSAVPGTFCQVQRSSNLSDWEDVGAVVEMKDGSFQFLDRTPEGATSFYRLVER
jgi:hypothetical protein